MLMKPGPRDAEYNLVLVTESGVAIYRYLNSFRKWRSC